MRSAGKTCCHDFGRTLPLETEGRTDYWIHQGLGAGHRAVAWAPARAARTGAVGAVGRSLGPPVRPAPGKGSQTAPVEARGTIEM